MRFKEALFIDKDHSKNNGSMPLLFLCGHDTNGKVLIIIPSYMPNEIATF